jgi:hypothetical protein
MTNDDAAERRERAERLKRQIDELTRSVDDRDSDQRPGESDAEYVQRRMRQIARKDRPKR